MKLLLSYTDPETKGYDNKDRKDKKKRKKLVYVDFFDEWMTNFIVHNWRSWGNVDVV